MKMSLPVWKTWRIDAAGAAVCAALGLAFYLGGVRPLLLRQESVAAWQEELESLQAQARRAQAELGGLQGRLEEARKALAREPLRLEPASGANRRLAELSDLATGCGLKVTEMQPGRTVDGSRWQRVPIHLAGSGTYRDCTAFLHRLRQKLPDTSVFALELTAAGTDPQGAALFRFGLQWHAAPG